MQYGHVMATNALDDDQFAAGAKLDGITRLVDGVVPLIFAGFGFAKYGVAFGAIAAALTYFLMRFIRMHFQILRRFVLILMCLF